MTSLFASGPNSKTDQSLTMRQNLALAHLVLVAEPSLLAGTDHPHARGSSLYCRRSQWASKWIAIRWGPCEARQAKNAAHVHAPRLCCEDLGMLRAAALAGLGVALLPEDCLRGRPLRRGALIHVPAPNGGTPRRGSFHLVFTTTRGMLPAVRAFVDHFAEAFFHHARARADACS